MSRTSRLFLGMLLIAAGAPAQHDAPRLVHLGLAADQNRLFQPFEQLHGGTRTFEGTGLESPFSMALQESA